MLLSVLEVVAQAGPLGRGAVLQVELDHAYISEVMRAHASDDTAALGKSLRAELRRSLKKRDHTPEGSARVHPSVILLVLTH